MNTKELSNRVNSSGQSVISSFESFKGQYQDFKNDSTNTHNQNLKKMKKMDDEFQSLSSAVNELKRSIEISRDPRFNRHH